MLVLLLHVCSGALCAALCVGMRWRTRLEALLVVAGVIGNLGMGMGLAAFEWNRPGLIGGSYSTFLLAGSGVNLVIAAVLLYERRAARLARRARRIRPIDYG